MSYVSLGLDLAVKFLPANFAVELSVAANYQQIKIVKSTMFMLLDKINHAVIQVNLPQQKLSV